MNRAKTERGREAGEAAALLFGVTRRAVAQLTCEPCRRLSRAEIEALQQAGKISPPAPHQRRADIVPLPW